MNAQMVDYDTVLANLEAGKAAVKADYEAKIAIYDNAIAAMKDLGETTSNGTQKSQNGSKELLSNAFSKMTILEATKSYLEFCGKQQTSGQIAKALKKHGIQSSSKDFLNNLRSILYKYTKDHNDIVRVNGKKWRLVARKVARRASSS